MENILSQLNADNLEIKLTSEKLSINTNTSNETFALRSVNGIGVVDLLEEYNIALTLWKSQKGKGPVFYFFGGLYPLSRACNLIRQLDVDATRRKTSGVCWVR